MTATPLTRRLRGALLGLTVNLATLGALLFGGTGTAHAYTGDEQNYLYQLGPSALQVPGSNEGKLNNGYMVCTDLRNGGSPLAEVYTLQQRSGLSLYYAENEVVEATAWLCRDQNWKSHKAFSD